MSRKNIGEKRQSFAMRKLSVGLVSVTVASFFLMSQGIQSVSADHMESPIHYKYMTEGELTDEEKSLLVEALPQLAEESMILITWFIDLSSFYRIQVLTQLLVLSFLLQA